MNEGGRRPPANCGGCPGTAQMKRGLWQGATVVGGALWRWISGQHRGFLIVTYHRVLEQPDAYYPDGMPVPVFTEQLGLFRRRCSVLPLGEILAHVEAGRPLPRRCVALTFDDGYQDLHRLAWPLLKQARLPATLFVAVQAPERGLLWPELMKEAVRHTTKARVELETLKGTGPWAFELASQSDRLRAVGYLQARLKRLPNDVKERTLQELVWKLFGLPAEAFRVEDLMLSWEQLTALASDGIEIGAHTMSHPILTRVPEQEAVREIAMSRKRLEERLGIPVRHFAYPNGRAPDVSVGIRGLVEAAGFRSACTALLGINRPVEDRFLLKRIDANRRLVPVLVRAMG